MEALKNLNLTEKDFDMLVEGLEALPERGAAGEMFMDLLTHSVTRDDIEGREKLMREREHRNKQKEQSKKLMQEDVRILQGKLLMLKRFFSEQNALSQAESILTPRADQA